MKVPSALRVRVPLVGPSTSVAVRVLPSASVSLVSTLPLTWVSSLVVNESSTATGASLTAVTAIVTRAVLLVADPSDVR